MRLKRRITVGLATAAAATTLCALGASAAQAAPAKVKLTWWTWTANTKSVIANFEKYNPGITIAPPPTYGSGSPFYAKLTTALEGGTAPCVTQVEFDHLPQFLAKNDLQNIAKYAGKYKKDFPAWVWGQVSHNGAVYAIPEDIGPMGLAYQPAVFAKYHLAVPKTWAQFAFDAVKLHKANPKIYLTDFPTNDGDQTESLFWQAGAYPYHQTGSTSWKVTLDGKVENKVMNYWGKLVKEGAVQATTDFNANWGHNIANGMYASLISAAWSPTYMIDTYLPANTKEKWAVAPMPQWSAGANKSANWGGSTNAVTKDCPSQDVKAAVQFAAWINTSKQGLTVDEKSATSSGGGRGLFPAATARSSVPQFNAPIPNFQGKVNQQFSAYAKTVPTNFEWSPWDTEVTSDLGNQLAAAAANKLPWNKILSKTQGQVVSYAKTAGYSVSG